MTSSKTYRFSLPDKPEYVSRDQLLVSGIMAGEPLHIIVCHWPSRYGGAASEPYRAHAASISNHIIDSLRSIDSGAKVVLMGDLNDDPTDPSCRVVLGVKKRREDVSSDVLFNTVWSLHDQGIGTIGYQDKWNLFDQIIVTPGFLGKDYSSLKFWKTEVFNREFLVEDKGKNKGYPHRTFSGDTFLNGYSDHFPVVMYLVKRVQ